MASPMPSPDQEKPVKLVSSDLKSSIPDVRIVTLKYPFPDSKEIELLTLPKDKVPEGMINAKLGKLGLICARKGMNNDEIYSVLKNRHDAWEPSKNKIAQIELLNKIIDRVRERVPEKLPEEVSSLTSFKAYHGLDFIKLDVKIEWAVRNLVEKGGIVAFAGEPKTGKTRLALELLIHMAIGKDYFLWKIDKPMRVMFWSLEMKSGALKHFLQPMLKNLTEEELKLWSDNFIVVPIGHSNNMETLKGQKETLELIDRFEPDGIVFDSWGAAVQGNINDATLVRSVTDFILRSVATDNRFVGFVTHVTKDNGDSTKQVSEQNKIFGSTYFVSALSTVIYLTRTGQVVTVSNPTIRLAEEFKSFKVETDPETSGFVPHLIGKPATVKKTSPLEELASGNATQKDASWNWDKV